jgi:hypothetical protein
LHREASYTPRMIEHPVPVYMLIMLPIGGAS